jgi:transcription initiation factor TFIIH subunit 4
MAAPPERNQPFLSYLLSLPSSTLSTIYTSGYNDAKRNSFVTLPPSVFCVRTVVQTLLTEVEKILVYRLLMINPSNGGGPNGLEDDKDSSTIVGVNFEQFKSWFTTTSPSSSSSSSSSSAEKKDDNDPSTFAALICSTFSIQKLCLLKIITCPTITDKKKAIDLTNDGSTPASNETSPCFIKLTKEFFLPLRLTLTSVQIEPWTLPWTLEKESEEGTASGLGLVLQTATKVPPTSNQLEMYTQSSWDSVLHFLVGTENHPPPPKAVVEFILRCNLMAEVNYGGEATSNKKNSGVKPLVITSLGYEFMLQAVELQIWQFVLQYLRSLELDPNKETLRVEALTFLLAISACSVGRGYPVKLLSKAAKTVMKDFKLFGLVYYEKGDECFYPTRVAVGLVNGAMAQGLVGGVGEVGVGGAGGSGGGVGEDGGSAVALGRSAAQTRALEHALSAPLVKDSPHIAIIVQTNFQVVAYTSSDLHVAMLGLFCDVPTIKRLPNMVLCQLTRESVKGAFEIGITATQILRFLKMHAHPIIVEKVRSGNAANILPDNVEDQIWLWNRERLRCTHNLSYRVQCSGLEQFDAVDKYARDNNVCLWSSRDRTLMYVKYEFAVGILKYKQKWDNRRNGGVVGGGGGGGGLIGQKRPASPTRVSSYE